MRLKWDNEGIKSPLSRARGLGSGGGVEHWIAQRSTALALIPLVIWFVFSAVCLKDATHAEFTAWLAQPLNAILMIGLVLAALYHGILGVRVITEDYVHNEGFKIPKLMIANLVFIGLGIASVFSILKIAFGA